jgi:hypothetical protein
MTNFKRIQAKARELAGSKLFMMGTPIFERRGPFMSFKSGHYENPSPGFGVTDVAAALIPVRP